MSKLTDYQKLEALRIAFRAKGLDADEWIEAYAHSVRDRLPAAPPETAQLTITKAPEHVCWDGCFGGFHLEKE